jgi:O-antigen/teichoic acid export membrane protein
MLVMSALLFPLCFGIVGGAREVVLAILGERWKESIPILRLLALATPFLLLGHIGALLLEVTAKLSIKLYIQVGNILLLCGLFFVLYPYGLIGLAGAVLCSSITIFVTYTVALKRLLSLDQAKAYQALGSGILTGCIVLGTLMISSQTMNALNVNATLALVGQMVLGAAVFYMLLISPVQRPLRLDIDSRMSQLNMSSRGSRVFQRVLWL